MNDFPSPPTDSMGGLASFQFIEVEGVASLGTRLNAVVSSIVLKIGFAFHTGYSSIDALKYDEKAKQSDDGNFFEATLSGFAPDSREMIQLFTKMDGRRFILRATDNDGRVRLIGTIDQPLTFKADFETQTASGTKGHSYEFSGMLEQRAPLYVQYVGSSSSTSGSGTT